MAMFHSNKKLNKCLCIVVLDRLIIILSPAMRCNGSQDEIAAGR